MKPADRAAFVNGFSNITGSESEPMGFYSYLKYVESMGWPRSKYPLESIEGWFQDNNAEEKSMDNISLEMAMKVFETRPVDEIEFAALRRRFTKMDLNNDGILTLEELEEFFTSRGMKIADQQRDAFLNSQDKNKDGKLTLEEFIEFQQNKKKTGSK